MTYRPSRLWTSDEVRRTVELHGREDPLERDGGRPAPGGPVRCTSGWRDARQVPGRRRLGAVIATVAGISPVSSPHPHSRRPRPASRRDRVRTAGSRIREKDGRDGRMQWDTGDPSHPALPGSRCQARTETTAARLEQASGVDTAPAVSIRRPRLMPARREPTQFVEPGTDKSRRSVIEVTARNTRSEMAICWVPSMRSGRSLAMYAPRETAGAGERAAIGVGILVVGHIAREGADGGIRHPVIRHVAHRGDALPRGPALVTFDHEVCSTGIGGRDARR